jgi:hypothetical protein
MNPIPLDELVTRTTKALEHSRAVLFLDEQFALVYVAQAKFS